MKELQNIVYKHFDSLKQKKKYLAVLIALSMLVSFMVPLILMEPADSKTGVLTCSKAEHTHSNECYNNGVVSCGIPEHVHSEECYTKVMSLTMYNSNVTDGYTLTNAANANGNQVGDIIYSPLEADLLTLIFGTGQNLEWLEGCDTLDEALAAAKSEYFLGLASDFCAFIEGDFTATEADAEGRVAVGGNLSFKPIEGNSIWNYQVASGDYASMVPLEQTDNYEGKYGFASALVGGKLFRINTLSTGYGHYRSNPDVENYDDAAEGYHTVKQGNKYGYTVYFDPDEGLFKRFLVGNVADSKHYDEPTDSDKAYGINCQHDYPGDCGSGCTHTYLESVNELSQIYQYDGIKSLISKVFADVRSRSANLSQQKGIPVTGNTLSAEGYANAETIYFDLGNNWVGGDINFTNIPEGANIVVNCGATEINIGNTTTKINGKTISKEGEDLRTNNNKQSERILYNFYNATNVNINGNFNGTILAPNADVRSDDTRSPGHLSGALIAKSFYGGLEFGYRPYRGGSNILGLTSGYFVPADKFVDDAVATDSNGNKIELSGAELNVEEYQLDENGQIVTNDGNPVLNKIFSWFSSDETRLVPFPSKIDYSGDTVYTTTTTTTTTTYVTSIVTTYTTSVDAATTLKTEVVTSTSETTEETTSETTGAGEEVVTTTDSNNEVINEVIEYTLAIDKIPEKEVSSIKVKLDTGQIPNEMQGKEYKIICEFYNGDQSVKAYSGSVTYNYQNPVLIEIDCADNNNSKSDDEKKATKIIIKSDVEVPIPVTGYELTYTEAVPGLVTVFPVNETIPAQQIINVPFDPNKKLNSIELLLDNEKFADQGFYRVICTLLDANNTSIGEARNFVNNGKGDSNVDWSKPFVLDYGSTSGVSQIQFKIDASDTPIASYKITTIESPPEKPDDSVDTPDIPEKQYQTIVHKYKVSENTPPEAYIKTDDYYDITFTEVVDLETVIHEGENYYPVDVETTVDIKKVSDTTSDYAKLKYRIHDEYENSNVQYRDIIVLDADNNEIIHFRMDINSDGQTVGAIYKVVNNDGQESLTEVLPKDSVSQTFGIDGKNYFFNPDVMMIMPLPSSNLEFENTPGLLFKKVNDKGESLKGATIQLFEGSTEITSSENLWKWSNTDSDSQFIHVSKLNTGSIYRIHEETPPSNHIEADDIYFEKINDTTIHYWTGSETKPESGYNELNLLENRVIEMVDDRILGSKLTLDKYYNVKTGENTEQTDLDGAKFSLYSNNGTLICSGLDGNGNIFDNEAFKNLDNIYVENGYLKPGIYYLTEDVIPVHPKNEETGDTFENPGRIYFTVDADYQVHSGTSNVQYLSIGTADTGWGSGWKEFYFITPNGSPMRDGNTDALPKIQKVEISANSNIDQYWLSNDAEDNEVGSGNYGQQTILKEYTPAIPLTVCKIYDTDSNLKFNSVKLTDSDGNVYFYSDTGETITVQYININNVLKSESVTNTTDETTGEKLSNLKIENKPDDGLINIPVKKEWAGDSGFENLREDSITVQLYQTKTKYDNRDDITADQWTQMEQVVDADGNNISVTTAVLDKSNSWTATFTELPSRYFEDGKFKPYYYYFKEVSVPQGYEDTYTVNGDGTHVVTNTLLTTDISAKKNWETMGLVPDTMIPESMVLKLQCFTKDEDGNDVWADISSKTITVKKANNFEGTFKNLPIGQKYRIVEAYSPNGWVVGEPSAEITATKDGENSLSITNIPDLGSLSIFKDWLGDESDTRPDAIHVRLYRALRTLWPKGQPLYSETDANGKITTVGVVDDYARLLQYSLYFYDGNMCGNEVDENSAYSWRNDCHTHDVVDGVDYTGGFHDAGDHVMFGLPAGFSASMLGWSIYEFPESYSELNQTAHMKIIEDYYCDFFMKCAKDDNNDGVIDAILYQKGDGTEDHAYWGMPEYQDDVMSYRDNEIYWADSTGGDIAAEYAAALALAYLNNQKTYNDDPEKYQDYLDMAKKFYDFAQSHTGVVDGMNREPGNTGGFYLSSGSGDDRQWAALWLWLATGDDNYKTEASKANFSSDTLNISWDSVENATAIAYALHSNDESKQNDIEGKINSKILTNGVANDGYMFGGNSGGWGQMRHNTAYQTAVLIANKFAHNGEESEWTQWCKNQMNYILGVNGASGNDSRHPRASTCFVTNFAENTLIHPHYRATSGMDTEMVAKNDPAVINGYDLDPYKLIGGLAGGWFEDGKENIFKDERLNYQETEVATDYNAGLVNAAAGLYSVYKTGHTYEIPGVKKQYLQPEVEEEEEETIETPSEPQENGGNAAQEEPASSESNETNESDDTNSAAINTDASNAVAQTVQLSNKFYGAYSILSAGASIMAQQELRKATYSVSLTPDQIAAVTSNGWNIPEDNELYRKNITKIEASFTARDACFRLNNQRFLNNSTIAGSGASWEENTLVLVAQEENGVKKFKALWDSDVPSDGITSIKCEQWGGQLTSITITYEVPGLSITNVQDSIIEGDTLNLTCSGATGDVTWTLPEETTVAKIEGNVLTANIVDRETTVTVTASDGTNTAAKDFTIKPLAFISGNGEMNLQESTQQTLELNSTRDVSEFNWVSSNPNIIEVTHGKVTAKAEGNATIIASITDSNGFEISVSFPIVVTNIEPLTLTISQDKIVINGTATLNPSDEVTYEGYDTNIIRIDGNTVTALRNGSTTITAKTTDNRTAQVSITVSEMSINAPKTEIDVDEEITLSINNQPQDSEIEWSSSSGVSVDQNGKIKGVSAGPATITAIAKINGSEVVRATKDITVNAGAEVIIPAGCFILDTIDANEIPEGNEKKFNSLSYANVTKIEIIFANGATGDGCNFAVNNDWSSSWKNPNGNVIERSYDPPINVTDIHIKDIKMSSDIVKIVIYAKIPEPEISGAPEELVVGETATLKLDNFNGEVTWSVSPEGAVTFGENGDATAVSSDAVTINAASVTDNVTITATYTENGEQKSKSVTINILPIPLELEINKESIRNDAEAYAELTVKNADGVTYSVEPQNIVTIDQVTGKVTPIAGQTGTVTITATKEGFAPDSVTLNVLAALTVTVENDGIMNVGDTIKLKANNKVGTIEWTSSNPSIVSVDQKGNATSKMFGEVIITAKDTDGSEVSVKIKVNKVGVTVTLPEGAEPVGDVITLTDGKATAGDTTDDWKKIVNNLQYTDENGNEYYYYIVETDDAGHPITTVYGDGATYIPISYVNGLTLKELESGGSNKQLTVGNQIADKEQGKMPSAGGDGTATYYYLGGIIMLLSAAGFIVLRRRQSSQR